MGRIRDFRMTMSRKCRDSSWIVQLSLIVASVASASDVASLSGSNAQEADSFEQDLLAAPFAEHRGSFFYAALGLPMLETAATLPPGIAYWRLSIGQARSVKGPAIKGPRPARGAQGGAFTGAPVRFL